LIFFFISVDDYDFMFGKELHFGSAMFCNGENYLSFF
jgi:hypothetical protein